MRETGRAPEGCYCSKWKEHAKKVLLTESDRERVRWREEGGGERVGLSDARD